MVVINGLAMMAGSTPNLSAKIGKEPPKSLAMTMVPIKVKETVTAMPIEA